MTRPPPWAIRNLPGSPGRGRMGADPASDGPLMAKMFMAALREGVRLLGGVPGDTLVFARARAMP